uniref:N-acetyltransferase domain-containing protein n=1 Tax=Anopheles atroparvus TaxID=41427 RepID=A0AAG5CTG2_ANOAO
MCAWKRPDTIPLPTVWHRFTGRAPDTPDLVNYVVQDVPEDRFEDCIQHMCRYFLRDEPICRCLQLADDRIATAEFSAIWRRVLERRCAVVCFREGDDDEEIVGLNMLNVVSRGDPVPADQRQFRSAGLQLMHDSTIHMTERGQLFGRFPLEQHFLSAWGLSVHPRFRGLGLAKEILRARIPLCRAMGFRLSATVFSHPGSQIPAARVGFRDAVVEKFSDLAEQGFAIPGITVEYNKLMVLEVCPEK